MRYLLYLGLLLLILSVFFDGTIDLVLTLFGVAIVIYTRYVDYIKNN